MGKTGKKKYYFLLLDGSLLRSTIHFHSNPANIPLRHRRSGVSAFASIASATGQGPPLHGGVSPYRFANSHLSRLNAAFIPKPVRRVRL